MRAPGVITDQGQADAREKWPEKSERRLLAWSHVEPFT